MRETVPRMPRGSQSPTTETPSALAGSPDTACCGGRLFACGDFGAEHAVIIGVTGQRRENLLAVDDPAAFDRLCLGAERDAAGCRRAAFRKWLRVDRAVADDALVMHGATAFVFGAGPASMSRSSASGPDQKVEQTCMFQVSAVAPQ